MFIAKIIGFPFSQESGSPKLGKAKLFLEVEGFKMIGSRVLNCWQFWKKLGKLLSVYPGLFLLLGKMDLSGE